MNARAPERVSVRQVLGVTEFRAVLAAAALSTLGDQVTRIAVAVLVFERTDSSFFAAATIASSYLTWLVGGPFLSALADRWRRRRLMVGCDVLRAGLILLLVIPDVPLWAVFAVLLLVGVLAPPFDSAKSAVLPEILSGDAYVAGNALIGAVRQGATVLGFLLGGLLVGILSASGALVIDAATFLVSALLLGRWVRERPSPEPSGVSLAREAIQGISLVRRSSRLRRLLAYGALGSVAMIAPEGLAVPVADRLGGGGGTAGVLTAALPAGFLLGSFLVLRVQPDRREALLPALTAGACLPLLLSPLSGSTAVLVTLWALSGVFSAAQLIANAAYMLATPAQARGRAFGVAVSVIMVTQGLIVLATGALAELIDPRSAVAAAAAGALVLLVPLVLYGPTAGSESDPAPSVTPLQASPGQEPAPTKIFK